MNYLYFYAGTAATNSGTIYPASSLRSVIQTGAGTIVLHFTPQAVTRVAAGQNTKFADAITLTVTSGKGKEVMEAIAKAVNQPLHITKGFVNIADDENGEYIDHVIDIKEEETDGTNLAGVIDYSA